MTELDKAMAAFLLIGGGWPLSFTLPGNPPSKKRPRAGKGRVYQDNGDREAERLTSLRLRQFISEPLVGNVAIAMTFYVPTAGTKDVDNMVKHVMDAANGILWKDDRQVTGLIALDELDRKNPRTEVVLGSHESSLPR